MDVQLPVDVPGDGALRVRVDTLLLRARNKSTAAYGSLARNVGATKHIIYSLFPTRRGSRGALCI